MGGWELQYCRCEIGQPEPASGEGCPIHGRGIDVPDPDAEDGGAP